MAFVGSANDDASTITDNRFINNELEGIGLGAAGSEITGNSFAPHDVYVKDYTTEATNYDLAEVIADNTFENDVEVTEDGSAIVDETEEMRMALKVDLKEDGLHLSVLQGTPLLPARLIPTSPTRFARRRGSSTPTGSRWCRCRCGGPCGGS